jgi:hypothetical protein
MTPDPVPLGGQVYAMLLVLLIFSRAMDFLSTWLATPNLVLEANPVARKLGWRWGIPVNVALCFAFACWPLPAVIISTTSVLVAARNFQSAWIMRAIGEDTYRLWISERLEETPMGLFLFCLFGQTLLVAAVGGGLIWFSGLALVPLGVGLGLVGYAAAVALYTLISLWRYRRRPR